MDADHVRLAHFFQELGQDLVKVILADLHTIGAPDGFNAEMNSVRTGGIQRGEGLADKDLGRVLMDRHRKMFFLLGRGRLGDRIDDMSGVGVGNAMTVRVRGGGRHDDWLVAGRAGDRRPGGGIIDRELLGAAGTFKIDIHRRSLSLRSCQTVETRAAAGQ